MTVIVNTGDAPEDHITLMRDRELKLVGSVFQYRDRIQRFLIHGLLRVATTSPAAYKELVPDLAVLTRWKHNRKEMRA